MKNDRSMVGAGLASRRMRRQAPKRAPMNRKEAPPIMTESVPPRRSTCERCRRPQSACICHWISPVSSIAEVLILQHPLETSQAKGSARLLHLCLPGCRLAVGEAFEEAELANLLHEPWSREDNDRDSGDMVRHPVLLYPETPGQMAAPDPGANGSEVAAPAGPRQARRLRLVVLDATWRKSRKMLYLNPALQALPRLALQDPPLSRYHVRKAHLPHQLSTFEATCQALIQLEHDAGKYQPLQQAFDGFVSQQLNYRPAS